MDLNCTVLAACFIAKEAASIVFLKKSAMFCCVRSLSTLQRVKPCHYHLTCLTFHLLWTHSTHRRNLMAIFPFPPRSAQLPRGLGRVPSRPLLPPPPHVGAVCFITFCRFFCSSDVIPFYLTGAYSIRCLLHENL